MKKLTLFLFSFWVMLQLTNAQNYAFNFTNRTDIVNIGDANVAPPWTAEMWVYKKATTSYSTAINGTSCKLTLETWGQSQKVGISKPGTADWPFPSGYVVPLTTWTHLAWVCNGTKTYLYVNGQLKDSVAQIIDLPMTTLGQSNESPNAYMDEIRMWKVARTKTDILNNMSTSVDPTDKNLVGYWYADDQSSPATDISPANHSGTLTGTTYVANTNPFTTNLPTQAIAGSSCEQYNEFIVNTNSSNQDILLINVKTTGVATAKQVNSISINTSETTNLADITGVKMYYTGGSKVFSITKAFGSQQTPAESITFSGTQALKPGNNYFWVAYNVASTATIGNKLDAGCTAIGITGESDLHPTPSNPTGSRTIQNTKPETARVISIIPKPVSVTEKSGTFALTATTKIITDANCSTQAEIFAETVRKSTGYPVEVATSGDKTNNISLELLANYNTTIGDEGYLLDVTSTGVTIRANKTAGIFYGLQSVRQLLPNQINSSTVVSGINWTVPNVSVTDYPRFVWRGFMLDVARHFFNVNQVKKYIDMMAMNKMNVFHWHLMDDQGFRMEVKSHPELTALASQRNTCSGETTAYDHGYYTQDEIKDVVAYALARNVNVEPELESPGHAAAWLTALPGLACTSVSTSNIHIACMNPGNSSVNTNIAKTICMGKAYTYQIMNDVINEMADLFPFKYVHIGGDEADHTPWATCTDCLKMMADSTTTALPMSATQLGNAQKFYLRKIQRMFAAKGKKVVGWTEMGLLDKNSVTQDWVGGSDNAINNGNEAIYSNGYNIYLDSYQGGTSEPTSMSWMGTITLDKVYNYNPPTSTMSDAQKKLALGIEACLWSEYNNDSTIVEYRMIPRIYAAAEASWTREEDKNLDNLKMRLFTRMKDISYLKFNYCPLANPSSTASEANITGDCSGNVTLNANFGSDYYYWNDESNSTSNSITVTKPGTYKVYGAIGSTTITRIFNVSIPQIPNEIPVSKTTNGSNTLYTGTNNSYAYKWYDAATGGNLIQANDSCLVATGNPVFVSASLKIPQMGLQFSGSNYISAPSLNINTNNVTYEAWIKLSGTPNDIAGIIFNRGTSAYGLNLRSNSQLMYHWNNNYWGWNSNLTVPQNQWVHVALVIKPTSATIYLDDKSSTNTATHNAEAFAEGTKIGFDQGSRYFKGLMDEVRIWNVAKTKEEILASMNTQLTGSEANLVAYYRMNEGTGSTTKNEVNGSKAALNSFVAANWNSTDPCPVENSMCESERISVTTTGLKTQKADNIKCTVYPNPNNGDFTIALQGNNVSKYTLKMCDILGHTINLTPENVDTTPGYITVKHHNISKGIYLIKIMTNESPVETLKVIVK